MTWREYHEATKHSVESLRRRRQILDWANMPDPFRHYEGAPVFDLPADPPVPEIPAMDVLRGASGTTPMALRRDAGHAAARTVTFLRELTLKTNAPTVATVGSLIPTALSIDLFCPAACCD